MNVDVRLGVDGYKTQVALQPGLYDGHPPLEGILFQTRMRILDPNVCAVSLSIVLQEYAAESIVFPDAVQVHVAEAIETFLSARRFRITPVEQVPAAVPTGIRRAVLGSDAQDVVGAVVFELGDSSSVSSSASLGRVHLASNVASFFADDETGFALATISAVTFVAPDYAFNEICLVGRYAELFDESEFRRYKNLLDSVNLKLTRGGAG